MKSRTASASKRSPIAVEPMTSQKSIVASFRRSRLVPPASRTPHAVQKRARSEFSSPHFVQSGTLEV